KAVRSRRRHRQHPTSRPLCKKGKQCSDTALQFITNRRPFTVQSADWNQQACKLNEPCWCRPNDRYTKTSRKIAFKGGFRRVNVRRKKDHVSRFPQNVHARQQLMVRWIDQLVRCGKDQQNTVREMPDHAVETHKFTQAREVA